MDERPLAGVIGWEGHVHTSEHTPPQAAIFSRLCEAKEFEIGISFSHGQRSVGLVLSKLSQSINAWWPVQTTYDLSHEIKIAKHIGESITIGYRVCLYQSTLAIENWIVVVVLHPVLIGTPKSWPRAYRSYGQSAMAGGLTSRRFHKGKGLVWL